MKKLFNQRWLFFAWLIVGLFFCSARVQGEGTLQIRPTSADQGSIQINAQNGSGASFALYNGGINQRLNVRVCNVGEKVYLGFSQKTNMIVRVFDPNRNLVLGPVTLNAGAGIITNYGQAAAGPSVLAAGGYNALTFTATTTGDFSIEFENTNGTTNSIIDLFDVTVADASNAVKPGRLWSKAWMVTTNDKDNRFNGQMFVYSDDEVTTKIDFNGIQPFEFVISSNSTGTDSTGNPNIDRMSTYQNKTYPQYKLFLNEPDPSCYPTGAIGEIVGTPSITGCPGDYCINVEVTAPGTMIFTIEANGTPGYQANTSDRLIQAKLNMGTNCIKWDGKDGLGNDLGSNASIGLSIQYLNGLTHLPLFDAEDHTNGYIVSYVRPKPSGSTNITLFWDDSNINTGNATDGKVSPLTGCTNASGCHKWSGRGNNSRPETINTWWYVKESSVNVVYSGNVRDIDANRSTPGKGKLNDTTVCMNTKEIPLKASLKGDAAAKWSVLTGNGQFGDINALTTKYTLAATDATLSKLTLLITSVNPKCPALHDTISIFLDPMPKLTLTAPSEICTTNPIINTSATVSNAGGIAWTGKGGMFNNASSLSVQYTPSSQELLNDSITLYATTTSTSVQRCPMQSDSVKIKVNQPPTLQKPNDTTLCTGAQTVQVTLKASSQSDSLIWSSTGAAPSPKKGLTSTIPVSNGNSVVVTLTAYKNGCAPVNAQVALTNILPPTITLPDNFCFYKSSTLSASVANPPAQGTFEWKINKVAQSNPSSSIQVTGAAVYSYHYSNQGVCEAKDSTIVFLPPALQAIDTSACANSTIALSVKEYPNAQYYWGPAQVKDDARFSLNVGSGITNYPIIVEDANKCRDTSLANVSVLPNPSFTLAGVNICPGKSGNLVATLKDMSIPSHPLFNFAWLKNGDLVSSSVWNTLPYSEPGIYTLQLGVGGCKSAQSFPIAFYPAPNIHIITDYKYCPETEPSVTLASDEFKSYAWLLGNQQIGNSKTITVSPQENASYRLKVSNEYGCFDSTNLRVRIVCPPRLFVPNVVTPFSQDINAGLNIYGAHYTNFEITIFNRWGEIIFNTKDPKNAWNGKYKEENMPIGTYPWMVTYEGDSEEYKGPYKKVGEVTVVR